MLIRTPSLQFFSLTKEDIDVATEARLSQEAIADQIKNVEYWNQLSIQVQADIERGVSDDAVREYRASLIHLAPTLERTGVAQYSVRWQLDELAAASPDAKHAIGRLLGGASAAGYHCADAVTPFKPSETIVCLKGPEEDVTGQFPFFIDLNDAYPGDMQAVILATPEVRQDPVGTALDICTRNDMVRCPSLIDSCPELAGVEKFAFIYREQGYDRKQKWWGYSNWLGLDSLWPANLPDLEVIYFLDESIRLKEGAERPVSAESTGARGRLSMSWTPG